MPKTEPLYIVKEGQAYESGSSIEFWAICDNDGGRLENPKPLVRYVFATEKAAKEYRKNNGYEPDYYPIHKVMILTYK